MYNNYIYILDLPNKLHIHNDKTSFTTLKSSTKSTVITITSCFSQIDVRKKEKYTRHYHIMCE